MLLNNLLVFYSTHKEECIGALIGFILDLAIIFVGFFKVLFIVICVSIGYYIGKRFRENRNVLKTILDKIFPPR